MMIVSGGGDINTCLPILVNLFWFLINTCCLDRLTYILPAASISPAPLAEMSNCHV